MSNERTRERVWAVMVGLVLADSSIVTLALPDVLREFDATVFGVSWVLTAFNIVLALAILPASRLARRSAPQVWAVGLLLFAGASLVCAVAPSIGVLIAARCVQALGGAAVVAAAIELLAGTRGSHREAAPIWGTAGIVGLAVGPAAGGLLTELLSWEAIFVVQLPVLLALPAALGRFSRAVEPGPAGRFELGPEAALGLLSAGLTGALFLLVIMLIEGWRNSPLEAAAIVSVVPLATLGARWVMRQAGRERSPPTCGGRRWGDSRCGRSGGAWASARCRRGLDVRSPAPRRGRSCARLAGSHRAGAQGPRSERQPRGGNDRRAPRRNRARHPAADPDIQQPTHRAASCSGAFGHGAAARRAASAEDQDRAGAGGRRADQAGRRAAPRPVAGVPRRRATR